MTQDDALSDDGWNALKKSHPESMSSSSDSGIQQPDSMMTSSYSTINTMYAPAFSSARNSRQCRQQQQQSSVARQAPKTKATRKTAGRKSVKKATSFHHVEHECEVCKKAFSSGPYLRQHAVMHLGDEKRTEKCPACRTFFTNKRTLTVHIRKVHGTLPPVEDAPPAHVVVNVELEPAAQQQFESSAGSTTQSHDMAPSISSFSTPSLPSVPPPVVRSSVGGLRSTNFDYIGSQLAPTTFGSLRTENFACIENESEQPNSPLLVSTYSQPCFQFHAPLTTPQFIPSPAILEQHSSHRLQPLMPAANTVVETNAGGTAVQNTAVTSSIVAGLNIGVAGTQYQISSRTYNNFDRDTVMQTANACKLLLPANVVNVRDLGIVPRKMIVQSLRSNVVPLLRRALDLPEPYNTVEPDDENKAAIQQKILLANLPVSDVARDLNLLISTCEAMDERVVRTSRVETQLDMALAVTNYVLDAMDL